MNRTSRAAVAAALSLLALCACGSNAERPARQDDKATATRSAQRNPAASARVSLVEAVKEYTAALFSSDPAGYRHVSARCAKQLPRAEWEESARSAHHRFGSQKATGVKVDQLSGDLARVSYGAGHIPQFERERQSWVREGGVWKWDACPSS